MGERRSSTRLAVRQLDPALLGLVEPALEVDEELLLRDPRVVLAAQPLLLQLVDVDENDKWRTLPRRRSPAPCIPQGQRHLPVRPPWEIARTRAAPSPRSASDALWPPRRDAPGREIRAAPPRKGG